MQVFLIPGDTFRAAAAEQLMEWGRRANVTVGAFQDRAKPQKVIAEVGGWLFLESKAKEHEGFDGCMHGWTYCRHCKVVWGTHACKQVLWWRSEAKQERRVCAPKAICAQLAVLASFGVPHSPIKAESMNYSAREPCMLHPPPPNSPVLAQQGGSNTPPHVLPHPQGCQAALKDGSYDIVICDTAGRLHTAYALMEELEVRGNCSCV